MAGGATCLALLFLAAGFDGGTPWAQIGGVSTPRPNLSSNIERPLRYRAEGGDFVIDNGAEVFNRSLYGGHTAFRVEGGDRPEFALYLPGRGGNLRLGTRRGRESRWLHDARPISTRYRPGELLYEIRDLLSEWFQLRPELCRDNRITVAKGSFELQSAVANIAGVLPDGARVTLGDARHWNDLDALLAEPSTAPAEPVAVARMPLDPGGGPSYLALQRVTGSAAVPELKTHGEVGGTSSRPAATRWPARYELDALPRVHAGGQAHFRALREQVLVRTPDPAGHGGISLAARAGDVCGVSRLARPCNARIRARRCGVFITCWMRRGSWAPGR